MARNVAWALRLEGAGDADERDVLVPNARLGQRRARPRLLERGRGSVAERLHDAHAAFPVGGGVLEHLLDLEQEVAELEAVAAGHRQRTVERPELDVDRQVRLDHQEGGGPPRGEVAGAAASRADDEPDGAPVVGAELQVGEQHRVRPRPVVDGDEQGAAHGPLGGRI